MITTTSSITGVLMELKSGLNMSIGLMVQSRRRQSIEDCESE